MTRLFWLTGGLALILSGCAANIHTPPQARIPSVSQPAPQATVQAAPNRFTVYPGGAVALPVMAGPRPVASSLTAPAPAGVPVAADSDLEDADLEDVDAAALISDLEAEVEEDLDSETLEDNVALQAADAVPPEYEGDTVILREGESDFPVVDNEKVRYFIDYFSGPLNKHVRTWLERSTRYLPMMQEAFTEQGLPRDLVYLAMIESGFNNKALSRARASGPWQFMERTGRSYGLKNDGWRDERRDPEKATRAAARHLADLYKMFDGDWYLAMAAYNAGAGKIRKAIERYDTKDFWQLTHGSYLRDETKQYVPKMLAALLIAKHPERYGFTGLAYQEPLVYELAEIPSATDLEVIARLADCDYETIKKLNPELKRWSTPPTAENYQVRLPVGTGAVFAERYAQLPENERVRFVQHVVRKGDTPSAIARRYGVSADEMLRFNKIRSARSLKIGQTLLIPRGGMSMAEVRESMRDDEPAPARKSAAVKRYTVRSGDSLWSLAKRFHVTESQLRSWNGLSGKALKPGQTLVVASGAAVAKGKVAKNDKSAASKSSKSDLKKVVYLVRAGDSLWTIGRQFAVNAQQIRDWNKLPRNPVLRPGQRLTLLVKST